MSCGFCAVPALAAERRCANSAVAADKDRIDDAVLALFYLGRHDEWQT
jgi:hypothetical protein